MVNHQIRARGVADKNVLNAMMKVKRHLFVPAEQAPFAYEDHPLPIGFGQTISQPYIVAFMTELLQLTGDEKVLEIGTGCGYQTAVLAELARQVYSIEFHKGLLSNSQTHLAFLEHKNVFLKHADGFEGWPEESPFDAVLVTAAPAEIPEKLMEQLKVGGRMVLPLGSFEQVLCVITKTKSGFDKKNMIPVRFVPMVRPASES